MELGVTSLFTVTPFTFKIRMGFGHGTGCGIWHSEQNKWCAQDHDCRVYCDKRDE